MEHIGGHLETIERNIKFEGADPVSSGGFTQLPNFILRDPKLSVGAKVVYAMFISYGWHNDFPDYPPTSAMMRPRESLKS